jgi:hypothetical protein
MARGWSSPCYPAGAGHDTVRAPGKAPSAHPWASGLPKRRGEERPRRHSRKRIASIAEDFPLFYPMVGIAAPFVFAPCALPSSWHRSPSVRWSARSQCTRAIWMWASDRWKRRRASSQGWYFLGLFCFATRHLFTGNGTMSKGPGLCENSGQPPALLPELRTRSPTGDLLRLLAQLLGKPV